MLSPRRVLSLLVCLVAGLAWASKQPNILFILADDMDALLNGYDPATGVAHMRQLNSRVRAEGALLTHYYLAYPLCSPSRSTILTGRFPHNHGFTNNERLNVSNFHPVQERSDAQPWPAERWGRDTVNVWLNKSGYHTMLCGKYMNGYHGSNDPPHYASYVPDGWGDWFGFQTIDFFGTRVNVNGRSVKYPDDAYQTDIIANLSLSWLQRGWQREKPFFMMLTPHAPHAPYTPAPRHLGSLKGLVQPADPAYNEPQREQSTMPGALANLSECNSDKMNSIYELRAEALLAIDEMIGRLLDQLEAFGVLDNTYVFFSSDNGYHLGQHRLPPGKRTWFEHDIDVPFIVRGPGIRPNQTLHDIVGNYDLAATWAQIAGASPTEGAPVMDGFSMLPMLELSEAAQARSYSLQEGFQNAEGVRCCGHYSGLRIRQAGEDAMYVEVESGAKAYFNSTADPWQTTNIYDKLDAQTKQRLASKLAGVKSCVGKACP